MDIPTTPTPSPPPAPGTDEIADIAEEWLEEEAEMSPWSRKVKMGIPLLPTGIQSPPPAGQGRPSGATWTRMMTWTSATQRSPNPRTHRGDPAETHQDLLAEACRDPRAEDHQDLVDLVDPEADPLAEEDPLDLAGPAEALLEDPLATPTAHREMVSRRPPGGGSSTSAGGSRPLRVR